MVTWHRPSCSLAAGHVTACCTDSSCQPCSSALPSIKRSRKHQKESREAAGHTTLPWTPLHGAHKIELWLQRGVDRTTGSRVPWRQAMPLHSYTGKDCRRTACASSSSDDRAAHLGAGAQSSTAWACLSLACLQHHASLSRSDKSPCLKLCWHAEQRCALHVMRRGKQALRCLIADMSAVISCLGQIEIAFMSCLASAMHLSSEPPSMQAFSRSLHAKVAEIALHHSPTHVQ